MDDAIDSRDKQLLKQMDILLWLGNTPAPLQNARLNVAE